MRGLREQAARGLPQWAHGGRVLEPEVLVLQAEVKENIMDAGSVAKIGVGIVALAVSIRSIQYGLERYGRTHVPDSNGFAVVSIEPKVWVEAETALRKKYPYVHKVASLVFGPVVSLAGDDVE